MRSVNLLDLGGNLSRDKRFPFAPHGDAERLPRIIINYYQLLSKM
jgi:hypothetical protein